jgi:uncharacterized membrane-anchored protein
VPIARATRSRYPALIVLAFSLWSARVAHAASALLTPDCNASGDTLHCHLLGFLHFLYAAAGLLALVLLGVVLLAFRFYRRNKSNPKAGE